MKPHGAKALRGGAEDPKPHRGYKGQIQITPKINSLARFDSKLDPGARLPAGRAAFIETGLLTRGRATGARKGLRDTTSTYSAPENQ